MKFIPLDGKKEPSFGQKVVVINKHNDWSEAFLAEKKESINGIQYTFHREDAPDIIDATHFLLIEPPKPQE